MEAEYGSGWSGGACQRRTPPAGTYDFQWGFSTHPDPAMAKRQAEQEARHRLIAKLSKAHAAVTVRVLQKHIDTSYFEPEYDPQYKQACVLAILPHESLKGVSDEIKGHSESLDNLLEVVAQEVRKAAGQAKVHMASPRWGSTGRGAGLIGYAVSTRLEAAVSKAGVNLTPNPRSWELRLKLDRDGEQCRATAWLGSSQGYIAMTSVIFHPSAVGEGSCRPPGNDFLDDAAIGLTEGKRPGSGGLTVDLEIGAIGGMLCPGRPYDLTVVTSAPAYVHIYSVTEEGKVFLGWAPEQPISGRWTVDPRPMALSMERGAEYRLVVVAVPVGSGAEALDRASPDPGQGAARCVSAPRRGLKAALYPPSAALVASTYKVWPMGEGSECPQDVVVSERHQAALTYINQLRVCPR